MRNRKLLVLTAGMLALAASSASAQLYSLTDLGLVTPGALESQATAINNFGVIAGFGTPSGGVFRASRWSSTLSPLDLGPIPPNFNSRAEQISDTGYIAGWGDGASINDRNAFRWDPATSQMTNLGHLPGGIGMTMAHGVNNAGSVVGISRLAGGIDRPFLWDASTSQMTDLGDMVGGTGSDGIAQDINTNGFVVGMATAASGQRGFIWDPSTQSMTDLGDLPGGGSVSYALAVNDQNFVAGQSEVPGGAHAFLWDPVSMSMQDLGSLNRKFSRAFDINASNAVVGSCDDGPGNLVAFLWTASGGMIDLSQHLDASGTGWFLGSALGINDNGEIVGAGVDPNGNVRGYLLRPVPAPGTFAATPIMSIMVMVARRRRTVAEH